MDKPKLYVLVGLSGSGKSTLAAQLAESNENTVIVSSDAIREELTGKIEDQSRNNEVFEIFHQRIRKNLEEGKNAIADATNLLIKSRLRILNMTRRLDVEKICIICAKPFEICREHNMKREHPVPESVLDKQIRKFQIPFYEEGWDDIQIQNKYRLYRSDQTNKLLLAMMGFDQKNPHHDKDLGGHAVEVMARFSDCGYSESYNLAALFHDVGKLYTQTSDDNGVAHYFGHESFGSYVMLMNLINRVDLDKDTVLERCFLINYHMLPFGWGTEAAQKRWRKIFGEDKYLMLTRFHECDTKE